MLSEPLNDTELQSLESYLNNSRDKREMTLVKLDGFIHAVVSIPHTPSTTRWLELVVPAPEFVNAQRIAELVLQHYNDVLRNQNAETPSPYSDGSPAQTTEWLRGFMMAFAFDDSALPLLLQTKDNRIWSLATLLGSYLIGDTDEDVPEDIRETWEHSQHVLQNRSPDENLSFLHVVASVIYRVFKPHRQKVQKAERFRDTSTFVRDTRKLGRNDPCSRGSGKKYKHCCGRALP